jgi:hypothetical protein
MKKFSVTNPLRADGKPEVAVDLLATEIVKVSKAADELLRSRLTDKALLILLSHSSGVSQKTCKEVLLAAASLAKDYTRR